MVVCSTVNAHHLLLGDKKCVGLSDTSPGMQGECFQDEMRETICGILLYRSQLACRLLPNAGYCLPS